MLKRVLVVVAVLSVVFAILASPVVLADANKNVLKWEVKFSELHYGIYDDVVYRLWSSIPRTVFVTTYFRWAMPGSVTQYVDQYGIERWWAGPPYSYEATGFQMADAEGRNSFVGVRWNSNLCWPGGLFSFERHPRRDVVTIANTTQSVLYFSLNGNRPKAIPVGKTLRRQFTGSGEIRLYTEKSNLGAECGAIWWRR